MIAHPSRFFAGLLLAAFAASGAKAATKDPWYIGPSAELTWNYSLGQVNASVAYSRGYTGAGQVVAVFDSGLDTGDNQFKGRIAGPGYDAVTNRVGVTADVQWHGTFVSGIIAADRDGIGMMGVAYDAKLLPIRVVNADGSVSLSDQRLANAVNYATYAGARVFNNSWNSSAPISAFAKSTLDAALPATLQAYRTAVANGAVVVFAAGNNAAAQPGLYAALPAYYPELKPGWLAAVATDATGTLASYSNACGAAAAWCLAAPGSNIISVYNRGYGIASGTSFAAPVLSGAVAILRQEFPYLTGSQILAILFQTANKNGIYADSSVYGQGLLDLGKATQPVGVLQIMPAGGAATPLGSSVISFSTAFGRGFVRALNNQPLVARDDFGRGYEVSLPQVAATGALAFDAPTALAGFGGNMKITRTKDGLYAFSGESEGVGTGFSAAYLSARALVERDQGRAFAIASYHVDPSFALSPGGRGIARAGEAVNADAFGVPYLSLAREAVAFAYGNRLTQGGALRVGVFSGRALSVPQSATEAFLPAGSVKTASVTGLATALDLPVTSYAGLGFDAGLVVEQGTVLGASSTGATAFGANTPTYFAGMRAEVGLGDGLMLDGGAHLGVTEPASASASLIERTSALVSTSFDIALTKANVSRAGDRLGLALSQPLRVISGTAHLIVPQAVSFDGAALYNPLDAPLAADGQELDVQGFYGMPIGADAKLDLGAMVRFEPGNVAGAAPDGVVMSRYQLAF